MKDILFVSTNDWTPWGGSEELWSQTALQLTKTFNVTALIKKWEVEPSQIIVLKKAGIEVRYKNEIKKTNRVQAIFYKIKHHLLKRNHYKKSHDFDLAAGLGTFRLAVISIGSNLEGKLPAYTNYFREKKIDYVVVVQLATHLRIIDNTLSSKLKEAYENAIKVYFLSKENVFKTEMLLGCKLNNTEYINNPFNYNQQYLEYINNDKSINIACVASFSCFHKSQDILISVLGQEKWKNRILHLNLYGEGNNKELLIRLIKLHDLENKVTIHGFEPDKTKIWKNNLACIMPSKMEGQSLAMLEAMSYGRMVISTDVGDANRLILNNKTGFLIPAPTYALIDSTLEKAWSRKDEWIKMGELSREHLFNVIKKDPVIEFSEKLKKLLL